MSLVTVLAVEPFDGHGVGARVDVSERQAEQLIKKGLAKMQGPTSNKMARQLENKAAPTKAAGRAQKSSASRAAQASPKTTVRKSVAGARYIPPAE